MVRYDDIVHAGVYRGIGVLDRLDVLEYYMSVPVLAQEHIVRQQAKSTQVLRAAMRSPA